MLRGIILLLLISSICTAQVINTDNRGLWAAANPVLETKGTLHVEGKELKDANIDEINKLKERYLTQNLLATIYEWVPEKLWKDTEFVTELKSLWERGLIIVPEYKVSVEDEKELLKVVFETPENPEMQEWTVPSLGVYALELDIPKTVELIKPSGRMGEASRVSFPKRSNEVVGAGVARLVLIMELIGGSYEVVDNKLKFPLSYTPVFKFEYNSNIRKYEIPKN